MTDPKQNIYLEWSATMEKQCCQRAGFLLFAAILIFTPVLLHAGDKSGLSQGQTIYVPAYSHIYTGNREKTFLLTVTLSIRNIDPKHSIEFTTVDYYETRGRLLKHFLDKPITLQPLESKRYIIPEREKVGGSGANFIVQWNANHAVNPPIVESIMIGAQYGQGISFSSRGQVVVTTD